MNNRLSTTITAVSAIALLCIIAISAAVSVLHSYPSKNIAQAATVTERPSDYIWSERPWDIRYLIFFNDFESLKIAIKNAAQSNEEKQGKTNNYWRFENLFKPTSIIPIPDEETLATMVIDFDEQGYVATPNNSKKPLRARLNRLNSLVLTTSDALNDPIYHLAYWQWGPPGEMHIAPAVCSIVDTDFRYRADFEQADRFSPDGNFGCREWTYQLYNRDYPYIDVASYQKDGTYIKAFVGWSRFEDPKKPVIGRHYNHWLCLHDCPNGEKPGIIADIKAWTRKHGYSMPKRPEQQPMFPDADFVNSDPDETAGNPPGN